MTKDISRRIYLGSSFAGAAALVTAGFSQSPLFGDEPTDLAAQLAEEQKTDKPEFVFELRIYTAAPGKMGALNQRFRDHTLRAFEKYGIKNIGYWTEESEQAQRLFYLIAYPDQESRDKMLVHGIAVDPEFLKVVADSEKDGKLTTNIESVILLPTDYSPLK